MEIQFCSCGHQIIDHSDGGICSIVDCSCPGFRKVTVPLDADGKRIKAGDTKYIVSTIIGDSSRLKIWRVTIEKIQLGTDRKSFFIQWVCKYELGSCSGTLDPEFFYDSIETASKAVSK